MTSPQLSAPALLPLLTGPSNQDDVGGEGTPQPRGQLSRLKANDSVLVPGWSWAAPVKIKTDGYRVGRGTGVDFMMVPSL